jgi:hypothetical protein
MLKAVARMHARVLMNIRRGEDCADAIGSAAAGAEPGHVDPRFVRNGPKGELALPEELVTPDDGIDDVILLEYIE